MYSLAITPPIKEVDLKPLPKWLKLRDVQLKMFDNLASSYRAGHVKQMVMAATASGKTFWSAVLFHRILTKNPTARLIFVVPRTSLVDQAYKDFQQVLDVPISVIRGQDERINLSLPIQIATIQTLARRIKKYPELFCQYDLMICDEAHIRFDSIKDIDAKWIIGLSATPYSKGLGLFYDDLVKSIPAKELTEQGIITPIRVLSAQRQIDTSKLTTNSTGEYKSDEEEEEAIRIVGDVLKEYEASEDMKGRPFIGFAKTISACIALAETFINAGHNVGYVHSKMSDDDCEAILSSFKNGHLDGVFSVVKLIEGFNYPEASALLLCTSFAPSKTYADTPNALGRYVQMFGRVRRSVEGNPEKYALVHDHGENYIKYGHPDIFELGFDELCTGKDPEKKDDEEKTEKDLKPIACPECNFYIEHGRICDRCGHELVKYTQIVEGKIVEFVDGVMVETESLIKQRRNKNPNKEYSNEEKIVFYGSLKGYGIKHGYAKGWASNQYKNKFGVWPNSYKDSPSREPTEEVKKYIKMGQIIYRARKNKQNA